MRELALIADFHHQGIKVYLDIYFVHRLLWLQRNKCCKATILPNTEVPTKLAKAVYYWSK